eukprot:Pgem_evm1s19191
MGKKSGDVYAKRTTKKDSKKETFNKYGKTTSRGVRIKEANNPNKTITTNNSP